MEGPCGLFMGGLFLPPAEIFSIKPEDFLRLATFLEKEEKSSARDALNKGVQFCSLPVLRLEKISSEVYRVDKHNGRHRSLVLRDNGYETMPVRIYSMEDLKDLRIIQAQKDAGDPEFTIPLPPRLDPAQWAGDSNLSGAGA